MATRRPAHNTPIHMDFLCGFFKIQEAHVDRRVVGWSVGRHVDHPYGKQISPWPAKKITENPVKKTGLHYSNEFAHSAERITVIVSDIFVVCKEETHQSLYFIN